MVPVGLDGQGTSSCKTEAEPLGPARVRVNFSNLSDRSKMAPDGLFTVVALVCWAFSFRPASIYIYVLTYYANEVLWPKIEVFNVLVKRYFTSHTAFSSVPTLRTALTGLLSRLRTVERSVGIIFHTTWLSELTYDLDSFSFWSISWCSQPESLTVRSRTV